MKNTIFPFASLPTHLLIRNGVKLGLRYMTIVGKTLVASFAAT